MDRLSWSSQFSILSITPAANYQILNSTGSLCLQKKWTSLSHHTFTRRTLLRRSVPNSITLDSKLTILNFETWILPFGTKVILRVSEIHSYYFYFFFFYLLTLTFADSFKAVNPFKMPEEVQSRFTRDCASMIAASCTNFMNEESKLNIRYKLMISFVVNDLFLDLRMILIFSSSWTLLITWEHFVISSYKSEISFMLLIKIYEVKEMFYHSL